MCVERESSGQSDEDFQDRPCLEWMGLNFMTTWIRESLFQTLARRWKLNTETQISLADVFVFLQKPVLCKGS